MNFVMSTRALIAAITTALASFAPLRAHAAPVVTVQSIPVDNVSAEGLFVAADADNVPELMVIDQHTVKIYVGDRAAADVTLQLPEGTSAVDVFDIDQDGEGELLAVHGAKVLAYELRNGAAPRELFSIETPLSVPRPQPFPYAMAVPWNGTVAIALPRAASIELRALNGAPVETFPTQSADAGGINYGRPLSVRSVEPPQAGGPNTLELRVSMIHDVAPDLPEAVAPGITAAPGRPGTLSHAREAALGDPAHWPWFPLNAAADSPRVLYALEPPEFRDTLIRIRPAAGAEASGEDKTWRYPGALMPYGDTRLPDFNGDGFVDLLLWKAPVPGASLDALTRAATGGSWPLTTTVHLYDPQKGRFTPRPASPIKHHVAVSWFVTTEQGSPLRHVVFEDFNGDGMSDFGCSAAPDQFSLWWHTDGFSQAPDFTHTFPAPLTKLKSVYAERESPVALMLFRSPHALHVVRVTR